MEEIEVTFKLENSCSEIEKITNNNNFTFVEKYILQDIYMCKENINVFQTDNKSILKDTILLRKVNNNIFKMTYKKKIYDDKGNTIHREKYEISVDSIEKAKALLENVGYKELINIKDTITVYNYKNMEIILENVDDLGMFLEVEVNISQKQEDYLDKITNDLKGAGFKFNEELFDVKKAEDMIDFKYRKSPDCDID